MCEDHTNIILFYFCVTTNLLPITSGYIDPFPVKLEFILREVLYNDNHIYHSFVQVLRPYNFTLGDLVFYQKENERQKEYNIGYVSAIRESCINVSLALMDEVRVYTI